MSRKTEIAEGMEGAFTVDKDRLAAGAAVLEDQLWKLDPENRPIPIEMLKMALERVIVAMAPGQVSNGTRPPDCGEIQNAP